MVCTKRKEEEDPNTTWNLRCIRITNPEHLSYTSLVRSYKIQCRSPRIWVIARPSGLCQPCEVWHSEGTNCKDRCCPRSDAVCFSYIQRQGFASQAHLSTLRTVTLSSKLRISKRQQSSFFFGCFPLPPSASTTHILIYTYGAFLDISLPEDPS